MDVWMRAGLRRAPCVNAGLRLRPIAIEVFQVSRQVDRPETYSWRITQLRRLKHGHERAIPSEPDAPRAAPCGLSSLP